MFGVLAIKFISLHLVDLYGKCRYTGIPYMDPTSISNTFLKHRKIGEVSPKKTGAAGRPSGESSR